MVWTFSFRVVMPYFSLYVLALGGSSTTIGIVNASSALASLFTLPLAGYIADSRMRARMIGIITCIVAFSYLPFAFALNWQMLAVGMFFQGLVMVHLPAMSAVMADSIAPSQRGLGFATTLAISQLVGVFAPFVGGTLIDAYGVAFAVSRLYLLTFSLGLIAGTIRFKYLKETIEFAKDEGFSILNIPRIIIKSYKSIWNFLKSTSRTLKSFLAILAIVALFDAIVRAFWVVYGVKVIGLTPLNWGYIILVATAVRIALAIPMGYLVDRYGRRESIIGALVVAPIPIVAFLFCQTFLQVALSIILLEALNSFLVPASNALMADLVPRGNRGRIMSAFGSGHIMISSAGGGGGAGAFVLSIINLSGSLIGGFLYDFSPKLLWFSLAVAMISCMIIAFLFVRNVSKPEI